MSDFLGDFSEFFEDFGEFLGDLSGFLGDLSEFLRDFSDFLGDFSDFLGDLSEFLRDFTHFLCDLILGPGAPTDFPRGLNVRLRASTEPRSAPGEFSPGSRQFRQSLSPFRRALDELDRREHEIPRALRGAVVH